MKSLRVVAPPVFLILILHFAATAARPATGFSLPDSVASMTLTYRLVKDLIVLPVTINDSVTVDLILDTGCRNLILFGRKFKDRFDINTSRRVQFSGLGVGKPVTGVLSLGNKVSLNHVIGQQIPVVIVPNSNMFGPYHSVDGVIGYDIFLKFEIELNPLTRTITFRPALKSSPPHGFTTVPMRIVDARPILSSSVYLQKDNPHKLDLMIDTGSTLSLLVKTTDISGFVQHGDEEIIGRGLNGLLLGYERVSHKLEIEGLEFRQVQTGIVPSSWHDNASIGMGVLKNYVVILNYCKEYVGFRRVQGSVRS